MIKINNDMNVVTLLNKLDRKKLLIHADTINEKTIQPHPQLTLGLVNRIWATIGALSISNLILWFFISSGVISMGFFQVGLNSITENITIDIIIGLLLTLNAIRLFELNKSPERILLHSFSIQESLTSIILGYTITLWGFISYCSVNINESFILFGWDINFNIFRLPSTSMYFLYTTIMSIIFSLIIFKRYKRPSIQFVIYLTTLIQLSGFVLNSIDHTKPLLFDIYFNLYYVVLLISTGLLFTHYRFKHVYKSLAYAFLTILLFITILTITTPHIIHRYYPYGISEGYFYGTWIQIYPIPYIIFLANSKLLHLTAGSLKNLFSPKYIFLLLFYLICAVFRIDGLSICVALIILGFTTHRKPLYVIGYIFIPIFLSLYLYVLELSMVSQSIALFINGIILITAHILFDKKTIKEN